MKSNLFNLGHEVLLSCNQGELIPIGWYEAVPGDRVRQSTSLLMRTQPLMAPLMHKVEVKIHHWLVPFRLIWNEWEDFITGGPNGQNASVPPYFTTSNNATYAIGSLQDYLGVPQGPSSRLVSALPTRAYNLIWNNFYRDQDLQSEIVINMNSGSDTTTSRTLQNAAWEKDYFTSCRPCLRS